MTDYAINIKMSATTDNVILKLEIDESNDGSKYTDIPVAEYNKIQLLGILDSNQTITSDATETNPLKYEFDENQESGAIETQSVEYKYTEYQESMSLKTEVYTENNMDYDPEHVLSVFPFVCGICDVKVKSISTYLAHFQIHDHVNKYLHCCSEEEKETEIENTHVYSCGACGLKFPTLCTLYKHLVTDEGVLDFVFCGDKRIACLTNNQSKHQPDHVDYEHNELVNIKNKLYCDRVISNEDDKTVNSDDHNKTGFETEASAVPKRNVKRKRKSNKNIYKTPNAESRKNCGNNRKVIKKMKYGGTCKSNGKNRNNNTGVSEAENNNQDSCKNSTMVTEAKSNSKNSGKNCTVVKEAKLSSKDSDSNVTEVKGDKNTKTEGSDEKSDTEIKTKCQSDKVMKRALFKGANFPCEICGKMVKYETLISHKASHGKHVLPCDICGVKFKSKYRMQQHKVHVHVTDKKFTCDECGKSFKALAYLRQHSKTHLKEANVQCPECGKMFLYKNLLRIHLLTHSENRQYKCNICGKGFKRQYSVQLHKEGVHEAVEKYPCEKCNKKFITKSGLRKHRMIHQPPRYTCQFCGKTFIQNSNMKIHLKVHRETTKHYNVCKEEQD